MKIFKRDEKMDNEFKDFDQSIQSRMKEMKMEAKKIEEDNKKIEDRVSNKINRLYSK